MIKTSGQIMPEYNKKGQKGRDFDDFSAKISLNKAKVPVKKKTS